MSNSFNIVNVSVRGALHWTQKRIYQRLTEKKCVCKNHVPLPYSRKTTIYTRMSNNVDPLFCESRSGSKPFSSNFGLIYHYYCWCGFITPPTLVSALVTMSFTLLCLFVVWHFWLWDLPIVCLAYLQNWLGGLTASIMSSFPPHRPSRPPSWSNIFH